jgi:hypothetical protein
MKVSFSGDLVVIIPEKKVAWFFQESDNIWKLHWEKEEGRIFRKVEHDV